MIPTGAMLYTQSFGSRPEGVEIPTYQTRAPTSSDTNFPIGKVWIYLGVASYTLLNITSASATLAATWSLPSGEIASTTNAGAVFLSTLSQLQNGNAPNSTYVPSSNDVATVIASVVVGAGVPATTTQQGYVFLATNAQAQAGALTTNYAINPASLASVFAVPFALGSTTPAAVTATTLGFTTATGTAGGTWASGGTAISIGADATTDTINIGTGAAARTIHIGDSTQAVQPQARPL